MKQIKILNIYSMSAFVEGYNRKKNFCFPFYLMFRRRKKVAPYEPVDCNICFFSIGASRNYYYKCNHGEFCRSCLDKWSLKSNNCPICRAEAKRKKPKVKKRRGYRGRRRLRTAEGNYYY
tara:strand:+ start:156 stop:515 length:360 start_codon:yes stop_codon:yes gene_type:complete